MPLSELMLSILVCPACKGDLEYDRTHERLICHACRLWFPIENGIPVMMMENAVPIEGNGKA